MSVSRIALWSGVLLLTAASHLPSQFFGQSFGQLLGAEPVYVEFHDDAGNLIPGPVELAGYQGSLAGLSFLESWLRPLDPASGQFTGPLLFSGLELTLPPSAVSPRLIQALVSGKTLQKIVLHFVKINNAGSREDFYRITLGEVHVVGHRLELADPRDPAGAGHDALETFGFVFQSAQKEAFTVIEQLRYLLADANGDTEFDISDPVGLLAYMFTGGNLRCPLAGDVNQDGSLDVSDAIFMLAALFTGGRPPPAPFPDCGPIKPGQSFPCAESACDSAGAP